MDGVSQLRAAKELFAPYPARYWIAGGWAVDLMVGRQRREHSDVDVLILANDLPAFARTFTDILVKDNQTAHRVRTSILGCRYCKLRTRRADGRTSWL